MERGVDGRTSDSPVPRTPDNRVVISGKKLVPLFKKIDKSPVKNQHVPCQKRLKIVRPIFYN